MSWTAQTKTASTFTAQSKTASVWDDGVDFLLQEIGDFLLQENGDKIILDQSTRVKNISTWSYQTKH